MTHVICSQLRRTLIRQGLGHGEITLVLRSKCAVSYLQKYCCFSVRVRKFPVSSECHNNYCRNYVPFRWRSLSTAALPNTLSTKHKYLHQNEENMNADSYLRTAKGYQNTFFDSALVTKDLSKRDIHPHPAVQNFIAASLDEKGRTETVTSPGHVDIVNGVLSNLKSLKDSELLQVLHHLHLFLPSERADTPEFVRIWSALDEECAIRSSGWSLDFLFQAADVWAGLKLARFSKFHQKFMLNCLRKCGRLKKEHFIRWMYCLNIARSLPNPMAKYEIEEYLRNTVKVKDLSIQEISVVAMTCFKTETAIGDPQLFEEILDRVISERGTIVEDRISVAGVAKFARYCSSPRVKLVLFRFQEAFLPELGKLGIQACTHLALIGTKSQSAYLPLVNAVVKIIQENIKDARLKDLERISLVMTMFDADCDRLGRLIVEELTSPSPARAAEVKEYGRCLPAILHYLSIREIFSHDLMNYVLGKEFRDAYYRNTSEIYLRELLCLDFCAELEVEGYTGARLSEEVREQISKSHVARVGHPRPGSKISAYEASLKVVVKTLESFMGGPEYYLVSNILPQHHCRKIIFCTDAKTSKPVLIPDQYRSAAEHHIKYIEKSSIRYHVLFTCNRNDYIFSEKKLTPSGRMIVRQLTKMGYDVHVVFPPFTVSQLNHVLQNL